MLDIVLFVRAASEIVERSKTHFLPIPLIGLCWGSRYLMGVDPLVLECARQA